MLTDALDGYLARRWKVTSSLGYVLDTMGDRAVHLAMVLMFFERYGLHPVLIWLLVFRDIGIYAVRVLSKDWLRKSKAARPISLFHTTCLRIWLALFLIRDGIRVFKGADLLDTRYFNISQLTLLCTTILVSYYGLYRSLSWLIDRDHDTT
jgi:phosphatidylglycerophosphate synthase